MLKAWSLSPTSATGITFNASSVATGENMNLVAYQDGKAFIYNDAEANGEATIQAGHIGGVALESPMRKVVIL